VSLSRQQGIIRIDIDMPLSRQRAITWLRGHSTAYKALRFVWRKLNTTFWRSLRAVSPRNPRFGPAKGTFSALELLRSEKVLGREVLPIPVKSEREPTPLRDLAGLKQDSCSPWPIFWTRHESARLVGASLVLMDDKKRICAEGSYAPYSLGTEPAYNYLCLPPAVHLPGRWTSIVSQLTGLGFCHWFMDGLPRLALLDEFPPDTGVLVPGRLRPYEKDTLDWLGLKGRYRLTPERHVIVDEFYFSSPTTMTGCYDPVLAPFLRRNFLKRADTSFDSPKRFYVPRVGVTRGVINDNEVREFFLRRGWGVVDTQELTMAQQIQLFARAEAVCAVHGAALTNLLWCQPGCRVLELLASNFLNGVYEGVARYVGVQHRFLIYPGDAKFRLRVDLRDLEREYEFLAGRCD
jgi:hypothetical protein